MSSKLASIPLWQILAGILAGPLFIVMYLIEGALRTDYNPLRHPVSSLSIGVDGWMQSLNFLILGCLLLVFSLAASKFYRGSGGGAWGPGLIVVIAIGFLGAGTFTTDPLSGYPVGTPGLPETASVAGILHNAFSAAFFVGFPILAIIFARFFAQRKNRRWMVYSIVSAITMFGVFILARLGFGQYTGFVEFGGLFQRITIVIALLWFSALAVHIWLQRQPSRT